MDNFQIPKQTSHSIIQRVAQIITEPLLSPSHHFIEVKTLTLFLLYCSWSSFWEINVRVPLSELQVFLENNPTAEQWHAFLRQCTQPHHPSTAEIILSLPETPAHQAVLDIQSLHTAVCSTFEPNRVFSYQQNLLNVINNYRKNAEKIDQVLHALITPLIVKELNQRFQSAPATTPKASHPFSTTSLSKQAHYPANPANTATKNPPKAPTSTEPPETPLPPPHSTNLFSLETLQKLANKIPANSPAQGETQQLRKLIDDVRQSTNIRQFVQSPSPDILHTQLQKLEDRFPHFHEVISFINTHLTLHACGKSSRNIQFPPILLKADPGVGKTRFARELALTLNLPFFNRDLSITSEAFILTGHDPGWKGAKPGAIFDSLIYSNAINPLVCLDELDKGQASSGHRSPLNALYTLLEPHSAEHFADEFLPLPLNASHINWIFTCNHEAIPDAILSRLEIFHVLPPTPAQLEIIAQSVWYDIVNSTLPHDHPFPTSLPQNVLQTLHSISPRVMRRLLTFACGQALLAGRTTLSPSDIETSIARYQPQTTRSIGFLTP